MRKAAILVASLDQRTADLLLDQMAAEQADRVRRAILHLGDVDPAEQDEIIDEFFRIGPLVPDKHPPGIELDGELTRTLAIPIERPRAMAIEEPIEEPVADKPPFRFLHETESDTLLPFLRRENPQTIALVAAHLPPERASELLAQLPSSVQVEVVRRLANLDDTDPHVLAEVERGLQAWLLEQSHHRRRRANGLAAVSAILDAAPRDARRQIMTNLSRVDRPLAGKLRPNHYCFTDLMRFDDESLIAVLRAADPELIVLALAGASAELVERVTRRLPAEQSRALNKALVHLGPTRLADVEDAQQALADLAADLESEGRIHADRATRLAAA
ncbi:MAG TPA: FliG C-terminal domain-containing protein [Pirellulales bacterium]|nr:FliG C-terminal domain-containing protein [Pirellulales bacterium]